MKVGDQVEKITGDYRYPGEVVAVFSTRKGKTRYVVESTSHDTQGMLHIFNRDNLRVVTQAKDII